MSQNRLSKLHGFLLHCLIIAYPSQCHLNMPFSLNLFSVIFLSTYYNQPHFFKSAKLFHMCEPETSIVLWSTVLFL